MANRLHSAPQNEELDSALANGDDEASVILHPLLFSMHLTITRDTRPFAFFLVAARRIIDGDLLIQEKSW